MVLAVCGWDKVQTGVPHQSQHGGNGQPSYLRLCPAPLGAPEGPEQARACYLSKSSWPWRRPDLFQPHHQHSVAGPPDPRTRHRPITPRLIGAAGLMTNDNVNFTQSFPLHSPAGDTAANLCELYSTKPVIFISHSAPPAVGSVHFFHLARPTSVDAQRSVMLAIVEVTSYLQRHPLMTSAALASAIHPGFPSKYEAPARAFLVCRQIH